MNFFDYSTIRPDRVAGTQVKPKVSKSYPRCWADLSTAWTDKAPVECQALGTERLGLCPKHERELLGG